MNNLNDIFEADDLDISHILNSIQQPTTAKAPQKIADLAQKQLITVLSKHSNDINPDVVNALYSIVKDRPDE